MPAENPLPFVFFDHLAKNAGMSVRHVLSARYSIEYTFGSDGQRTDLAFAAGAAYPLVVGHVTHRSGFDPTGYRYCAAVLRHPVDRTLSAYNYFKQEPNFLYARGLSEMPPLEKVLEDPFLSQEIGQDFQCRHFAMAAAIDFGDIFQAAKSVLKSYHLVGVQEELEGFLRLLCQHLSLEAVGVETRYNISKPYPDRTKISSELLRRIEEVNRHDVALWEWVKSRADALKKADPVRLLFFKHFGTEKCAEAVRNDVLQPNSTVQLLGTVLAVGGKQINTLVTHETADFKVILYSRVTRSLTVEMTIRDTNAKNIFSIETGSLQLPVHVVGNAYIEIVFSFRCDLAPGAYCVNMRVRDSASSDGAWLLDQKPGHIFEVVNRYLPSFTGLVYLPTVARVKNWEPGPSAALMPPLDARDVSIVLSCAQLPDAAVFSAGGTIQVGVLLQNRGSCWFYTRNPAPILFSYHLLSVDALCLIFEGERTPLIAPVGPGGDLRQNARIVLPSEPGEYVVRLTLVQEGQFWFDALADPIFFDFHVVTGSDAVNGSA